MSLKTLSVKLRPFHLPNVWKGVFFAPIHCSNHSRLLIGVILWRKPWWRHQIETFSALLASCAGNSPVSGEFPAQRPVTRSFDIFFDLRLNKRLSKQSSGWWFETLSCPLWRQRNGHGNSKGKAEGISHLNILSWSHLPALGNVSAFLHLISDHYIIIGAVVAVVVILSPAGYLYYHIKRWVITTLKRR